MDTTYVYNQVKLPTEIHSVVDNFPDTVNVQGALGLCDGLSSSMDSIQSNFGRLISIEETVRDYGTGSASWMNNVIFVVCGSATNWMLKNLIHSKGELHKRLTHDIPLHPFDLATVEKYCHSRRERWDRLSFVDNQIQ